MNGVINGSMVNALAVNSGRFSGPLFASVVFTAESMLLESYGASIVDNTGSVVDDMDSHTFSISTRLGMADHSLYSALGTHQGYASLTPHGGAISLTAHAANSALVRHGAGSSLVRH